MYNGIGLATARGSGTNGYVQKNLSHLRAKRPQNVYSEEKKAVSLLNREPNAELILHDRKRQIEIKCMQLQDMLESNGEIEESDIELKVAELRADLLLKLEAEIESGSEFSRTATYVHSINVEYYTNIYRTHEYETHFLAKEKMKENEKMATALGIDVENHVEGEAFDEEVQQRKKEEKILARERKMLEKELRRREREQERERRKLKQMERLKEEEELQRLERERIERMEVERRREMGRDRFEDERDVYRRREYSRGRSRDHSRRRSPSPPRPQRGRSRSFSRSRSRSRSSDRYVERRGRYGRRSRSPSYDRRRTRSPPHRRSRTPSRSPSPDFRMRGRRRFDRE